MREPILNDPDGWRWWHRVLAVPPEDVPGRPASDDMEEWPAALNDQPDGLPFEESVSGADTLPVGPKENPSHSGEGERHPAGRAVPA